MNLSAHELGFEGLDALTGVDSLCLFIGEDERPLTGVAGYVDWRLCGALSRVLLGGFFTGVQGDTLLIPAAGRLATPRVFVVGLGRSEKLSLDGLFHALTTAAAMLSRAKVQAVALELPGANALEERQRVTALSERFLPKFNGARVAVLGERSLTKLLPVSGAKSA